MRLHLFVYSTYLNLAPLWSWRSWKFLKILLLKLSDNQRLLFFCTKIGSQGSGNNPRRNLKMERNVRNSITEDHHRGSSSGSSGPNHAGQTYDARYSSFAEFQSRGGGFKRHTWTADEAAVLRKRVHTILQENNNILRMSISSLISFLNLKFTHPRLLSAKQYLLSRYILTQERINL